MARKRVIPQTETLAAVLSFNPAAMAAFTAKTKGEEQFVKFRVAARDGVLMIKPTDRKAGPHVLPAVDKLGTGGGRMTIEGYELDKLGVDPGADTKFSVIPNKYGWFTLANENTEGALEGATAKVSKRIEKQAA